MRAAVCPTLGGPEVVEVVDMDPPALGGGQVRVQIHAAAVNFPDVLVIAGEYQIKMPPPFVPGSELAGEVVEVAEDVGAWKAGDRVFGSTLVGAFAEEAVVGASSLTAVPDGVAMASAAAFGVAHRTSYNVLKSVADIHPGEQLVVLGAGGGVGLAAVQLGSLLGATVTAVASSQEKLDAARAFGATNVINHRDGDLRGALRAAVPGGVDVVVDPVGGDLAEPALRSMRWGGRFVTVGYASGVIPKLPLNLVLLKGVRIVGFEFLGFVGNEGDAFLRNDGELLELLASGRALPRIGATFPLDEVVDALRYVGDGRAIGKVVLNIAGV